MYDGHLFGKESYYEELEKVQELEMDRREKAVEAKKKLGDNRLKDSQPTKQHRKSKSKRRFRIAPFAYFKSDSSIQEFETEEIETKVERVIFFFVVLCLLS